MLPGIETAATEICSAKSRKRRLPYSFFRQMEWRATLLGELAIDSCLGSIFRTAIPQSACRPGWSS